MTTIHHATLARAMKLGATALELSSVTGNATLTWNGNVYESEDPKELVKALDQTINHDNSDDLDALILEPEDTDDGEDEPARGGSVVPPKYKKEYAKHDHSCGDGVAKALHQAVVRTTTLSRVFKNGKAKLSTSKSIDMATLSEIAANNDVDMGKWSHLSNGQQRMNLGNVLRGRIRNMKPVNILGVYLDEKSLSKS